jgi:hypothetical protein
MIFIAVIGVLLTTIIALRFLRKDKLLCWAEKEEEKKVDETAKLNGTTPTDPLQSGRGM